MSLLEGHADVMMDEVGPQVIPSVAQIRERFTQRRQGVSGVDLILRRVLGLEAKMRQYSDGAGFVRGVMSRRPRRLQRRLVLARDAPDARRDRRPAGLGSARPRSMRGRS